MQTIFCDNENVFFKCKACDKPINTTQDTNTGNLCAVCYTIAMDLIPESVRQDAIDKEIEELSK